MIIGLLCDYLETDEIGIKQTAQELGVDLVYIPFRKISITIDHKGYKVQSKGNNYTGLIKEDIKVVLNRVQSKNRRLMAATFLEAINKPALNPLHVEFLCFSKFRTLLHLSKSGIKVPRTVFIPCNPRERTKHGKSIHNEEEIVDLLQQSLDGAIVIKPDAGTHGRGIKLAKNREELLSAVKSMKSSIINPAGILAQDFIQKWFYDLRIIVSKEKGKAPYCHPKAMARAGLKDFRTNTALGNFVLDVDLPLYVRELASRCGVIISGKCDAWVLALDAMVPMDKNKFNNETYVMAELKKLAKAFQEVKKVKSDPSKKKAFPEWNKNLEESFRRYKSLEAYENIKKIINESVEKGKHEILFHEANSCPEFWEQTRLATGANIAEYLLKCARSIFD
ncbi:MAG: hypothetical protein RMK50_00445 [Nitrososphaerota archaeon]|nr:hypothetical protein [Candidatus Bathyarchaeota archaeon]MDW8193285.1 hypothetical protein [Nitrososphaerota archaeon]